MVVLLCYYSGKIVNDISGITRKSTDKNLIGRLSYRCPGINQTVSDSGKIGWE